jgi:hypothetical protein
MLAAVVVSSAVTIKDDPAADLAPPASAASLRTSQASQSRLVAAYGKLPLNFERNQGQTDPRVKFLSRGSGYSLFLTGNEAVLTLQKGRARSKVGIKQPTGRLPIGKLQRTTFMAAPTEQERDPRSTAAVLRMELVGTNARAKVVGLEELPGKSNYFIGKDPTKWRTNVPNYARVKYANVYPGVDLVYYGNQRQLEYDLVLAPGADPRQIELSFEGAKRLRLDADGDLVVSIAGGDVIEHKPVIYQDIGGGRQRVAGSTRLGTAIR